MLARSKLLVASVAKGFICVLLDNPAITRNTLVDSYVPNRVEKNGTEECDR